MNIKPIAILALALLALFPQGITGEIYTTGAAEIAGALGLSVDEGTWFKTLNMFGQLTALPLASWLVYRIGYRALFRLGAAIGLISAIISSLWMNPAAQMIAWLGHGISASFLLLFTHAIVLKNLNYRAIAWVESIMLLSVVLIPLSIYPYILAHLAENNLWHLAFAIQVAPFLMMLFFARFGQWPVPEQSEKIQFNWIQALLLSGFICGVSFLLLRGERYNWFHDPMIIELTVLTLLLGVAAFVALRRKWGRGEYIRTAALSEPHGKAGMLDAAVAGFVILGSTMLISSYVTQVMQYNHEQLGELEMIGFSGMIGGLIIALIATSNPKLNPEKVIPVGVSIMVVACALLAGSNSQSGVSDLWLPLLLKGLAVGILNITLTIHILRSFPKRYVIEGIAWFYLFRNLGSMLAITEFSRLMSIETANSMSILAENFNASSDIFIGLQQSAVQVLQQSGNGSAAESSVMLLIGQLKTQALSIAGINNFQWLIFSIAILVPVMALAMKWATQHPHSQKNNTTNAI